MSSFYYYCCTCCCIVCAIVITTIGSIDFDSNFGYANFSKNHVFVKRRRRKRNATIHLQRSGVESFDDGDLVDGQTRGRFSYRHRFQGYFHKSFFIDNVRSFIGRTVFFRRNWIGLIGQVRFFQSQTNLNKTVQKKRTIAKGKRIKLLDLRAVTILKVLSGKFEI